jgi:hypothetical protein
MSAFGVLRGGGAGRALAAGFVAATRRAAALARGLPACARDKAFRLLVLRAALAPNVALAWARRLRKAQRRHGLPEPPARMLMKPLRSYLTRDLRPRDRLEILVRHHDWMERTFSPAFLASYYLGEATTMARAPARKGAELTVALASSLTVSTQREGEIAFLLFDASAAILLARLTLTYWRGADGPALVIGGLQGPAGEKRAVIEATRLLYGLRPKDAIVLAARAFARALGLPLLAVDDARHILERLHGSTKQARHDAYWLERGAEPFPSLGFRFPVLQDETGGDARARTKSLIVREVAASTTTMRSDRPPAP